MNSFSRCIAFIANIDLIIIWIILIVAAIYFQDGLLTISMFDISRGVWKDGREIQKTFSSIPHSQLLALIKKCRAQNTFRQKTMLIKPDNTAEINFSADCRATLEQFDNIKKYLPFYVFLMHPNARQGFRAIILCLVIAVISFNLSRTWFALDILMLLAMPLILIFAIWKIALATMEVA